MKLLTNIPLILILLQCALDASAARPKSRTVAEEVDEVVIETEFRGAQRQTTLPADLVVDVAMDVERYLAGQIQ
jgi:hypothetical protein